MPNNNPTGKGGNRFAKGNSGGPGRPSGQGLTRNLNRVDIENSINKYFKLSFQELLALSKDFSLPSGDHILIRIMINAMKNGDPSRMEFILNRMVGKVADKMEVTSNNFNNTIVEAVERREREAKEFRDKKLITGRAGIKED